MNEWLVLGREFGLPGLMLGVIVYLHRSWLKELRGIGDSCHEHSTKMQQDGLSINYGVSGWQNRLGRHRQAP